MSRLFMEQYLKHVKMDSGKPPATADLGLLLLHALPLDGSMWESFRDILPSSTFAPTLYDLGNSIEEWAEAALQQATSERLIVVGCSVGASCAIEIAAIAPERVAALVLIGCKADHSPDPVLHKAAVDLINKHGVEPAWNKFWRPLFSQFTKERIIKRAQNNALDLGQKDLTNGVTVFHTRPSRGQFLAQCDIPITIVTGEDDIAPGIEKSLALSTSVKNGSLHIIPKCGHYVPIERPQTLKAIISNIVTDIRNPKQEP